MASSAGGGAASDPPAAQPSTGGGGGEVGAFGDVSVAVIVFEGERYEWTDWYCFSFGGGVGGQSLEGDPSFFVELPDDDWAGDPLADGAPALHLEFEADGLDFVAGNARNGAVDEIRLAGGIDDWTMEETQGTGGQYDIDHRATGTATFVNRTHYQEVMFASGNFDQPAPEEAFVYATGTFELTCI